MSIGSVYTVGLEEVRRSISETITSARSPDAMVAAAKAVELELRKHFLSKNQKPNKRGWQKSGFWGEIRSSVLSRRDGSGALVEVNDPRFLTHLHGARITPKRGRALAIPLTALAAGRSPRSFPADELFRIKGRNILARSTDSGIQAMYALVASVKVPRDLDALPPDQDIQGAADRAAAVYWQGVLRKSS